MERAVLPIDEDGLAAAVWLAGVYLEHNYVSGVGTGLVAAALLLRMARPDEQADYEPDGVDERFDEGDHQPDESDGG